MPLGSHVMSQCPCRLLGIRGHFHSIPSEQLTLIYRQLKWLMTILPLFRQQRSAHHVPYSSSRLKLIYLGVFLLVFYVVSGRLSIIKRDLGYMTRPLWDTPEPSWNYIAHYPKPAPSVDWCGLHGWKSRSVRPLILDVLPISTELDALEIRMREYAGYVDILVIVESGMTFAGTPKPLHFALNRHRFDAIAKDIGMRIVYSEVQGFQEKLPPGSFHNENLQRLALADSLQKLRGEGLIPDGSLVIQSDVDEIISRETLELLSSCTGYPSQLHLSVANYRYSYNLPIGNNYWRPRLVTVDGEIEYHHARSGDDILSDAGWHCSFCFATLDEIRQKMMGYAHNDRMTSKSLLGEKALRRRVCNGEDPSDMWPVSCPQ